MGKISPLFELGGKKLKVKAFGNVYSVVLHIAQYHVGGAIAVQLLDEEDGDQICTLTCNLAGAVLNDREILVKTWSENEEIAKSVLASRLFRDTGKRILTGFVEAQIWEMV